MSLKSQNVFFDVALLQEHVARLCNEPTNTPDVHTAVKHPSGHTVTQLLRLFWRLAKHAEFMQHGQGEIAKMSGKMVVNTSGPRMTEVKKPVGKVRLFPI